MKLKRFTHIRPGKYSAGTTLTDDEPRADMFLPAWLFVMGLLLSMFGAIIGIVFSVAYGISTNDEAVRKRNICTTRALPKGSALVMLLACEPWL